MSVTEFWVLVIILGVLTFGIRFSFLAIAGNQSTNSVLSHFLKFIPPAVMASIALPTLLFLQSGSFSLHRNERLFAGLFALIIACWKKNVWLTISCGMGMLWFLKWIMG